MLTIFAVPKPFRGHIGIIQRNAIRSWQQLRPACEIFLCGLGTEIEDVAAELGTRCVSNIRCNRFGTPLLDSVFAQVASQARHRLLCYTNADIIFLPDLLQAAGRIGRDRFLMVGQRWNLNIARPLAFDDARTTDRLLRFARRNAILHPPAGSDYFLFPRDIGLDSLPPFAVGREGWDNWMIAEARRLKIPVIDATFSTTVLHQNHDYAHVPNGDGKTYFGAESDENLRLLGPDPRRRTLADATHVLMLDGLRKKPRQSFLLRRMRTLYGKYWLRREEVLSWANLRQLCEYALVYRYLEAEQIADPIQRTRSSSPLPGTPGERGWG